MILGFLVASASHQAAWAQDTSAIVAAAREKARKVEEVKVALNDPDATVRLAVLEGLLMSDDGLLRDIAIETGLASGESALRSLAFRHAVLRRTAIQFRVSFPDNLPAEKARKMQAKLDSTSVEFQLAIKREKVDFADGSFAHEINGGGSGTGKVSGLLINFENIRYRGEAELQPDNTLAGTVTISDLGPYLIHAKLF